MGDFKVLHLFRTSVNMIMFIMHELQLKKSALMIDFEIQLKIL